MTSCLFEDEMGLVWKFAGHNSPLFGRREEDEVEHPGHNFNVNDTIAWWLSEVRVHFRVGNYLGDFLFNIPLSRELPLKSWLLECLPLDMAGSSWTRVRWSIETKKSAMENISPERVVLLDSRKQPTRAVHWTTWLPRILRDLASSQQWHVSLANFCWNIVRN